MVNASVAAVAAHPGHEFSKLPRQRIRLLEGLGVEGDAHCGTTVQHRSRVARDPTQANLRQVHLIHEELLLDLAHAGFDVVAGQMGENITTRGISLLDLPQGAVLQFGGTALVRITGLRNPCSQIDQFRPGLMAAVLGHASDGSLIRKSGVMAVVLATGDVVPGDTIRVMLPPDHHQALSPV